MGGMLGLNITRDARAELSPYPLLFLAYKLIIKACRVDGIRKLSQAVRDPASSPRSDPRTAAAPSTSPFILHFRVRDQLKVYSSAMPSLVVNDIVSAITPPSRNNKPGLICPFYDRITLFTSINAI
jgi:hypothetical protein